MDASPVPRVLFRQTWCTPNVLCLRVGAKHPEGITPCPIGARYGCFARTIQARRVISSEQGAPERLEVISAQTLDSEHMFCYYHHQNAPPTH